MVKSKGKSKSKKVVEPSQDDNVSLEAKIAYYEKRIFEIKKEKENIEREKENLEKIVLDIENYDVNNVTPMKAMKFLFELKEKIKKDN